MSEDLRSGDGAPDDGTADDVAPDLLATVTILTYNGERYLGDILGALSVQRLLEALAPGALGRGLAACGLALDPQRAGFVLWVVLFVALLTFLNLRGIQWTARANQVLTAIMCLVIGIFVVQAARYLWWRLPGLPPLLFYFGARAYLQAAARPGGVLVSSRVYQQTRALFDFQTSGTTHIKGFDQPILVFEVVGDRAERRNGGAQPHARKKERTHQAGAQ